MTTKERVIQLIDSLPDTRETELQLEAIAEQIEPNGTGDEGPIPTLADAFEIFASVDFPPREDAWR